MVLALHLMVVYHNVQAVDVSLLRVNHCLDALDHIYFFFQDQPCLEESRKVDGCLRSDVFTNHGILVESSNEPLLDSIQVLLQLVDVLLSTLVLLFHDLFLGVELPLNVFVLRLSLIDGRLELFVLGPQDINLPRHSFKFYFSILGGELLVLLLALYLQKLSSGIGMVLLLLLVLFDPPFSIFFLRG